MTLAELAALVKVNKSYLSEIETRQKEPSLQMAIRLSKRTKIPVEEFAL